MHMYTFKHIVARFKFPFAVQLLIAANDLVYLHMRKHKSASAVALYNSISNTLDQAYAHYKLV